MIKQSLKVQKPGNIVLCLKSSKYILDNLFTLGGNLALCSTHGLGSSAAKATSCCKGKASTKASTGQQRESSTELDRAAEELFLV